MEQYPISKEMRRNLAEYMVVPAVRMIVEAVEACEHGDADLDMFTNVTLEQYAEIATDLAIVIGAQS